MSNLRILPAILLAALVACGGGSSSTPPPVTPPATQLAYADPATGTYQLRRNAGLSTPTHLVLDLWGPSGASGCGVTLALSLGGSAAAWTNVRAADPAKTYLSNGAAFELGAGAPILKALLTGSTLTATVAEKGTAHPKALDKALLQVALDLQPGTLKGATATLAADPAKCQVLNANGTLSTISVTASGITAQ